MPDISTTNWREWASRCRRNLQNKVKDSGKSGWHRWADVKRRLLHHRDAESDGSERIGVWDMWAGIQFAACRPTEQTGDEWARWSRRQTLRFSRKAPAQPSPAVVSTWDDWAHTFVRRGKGGGYKQLTYVGWQRWALLAANELRKQMRIGVRPESKATLWSIWATYEAKRIKSKVNGSSMDAWNLWANRKYTNLKRRQMNERTKGQSKDI